jgi:hypothetical protein
MARAKKRPPTSPDNKMMDPCNANSTEMKVILFGYDF